jgi:hypothetical protein
VEEGVFISKEILKMPMKKNSTLIYFVNNFQVISDSYDEESMDLEFEGFLAGMEKAEKAPSDQTINNILNFARSYEVIETEKTGFVEMILN